MPQRRRWSRTIPIAGAIALASGGAGVASGADGGGGVGAPDPPKVSDAVCIERCGGLRKATEGSKVKLSGRHLDAVRRVTFAGKDGERVSARARTATARRVVARVPAGAATGRPKAIDSYGNKATSPVAIRIVRPGEIPEGGEFRLTSASAKPRKVFFDAAGGAKVRYTFRGEPTDVRIDVVKRGSGTVVRSFRQRDRKPYVENVARWDGKTESGRPASSGRYAYRIGSTSSGGAKATDESRFGLYGNKFPVRARHSYGEGFGAGRGHQGVDILSRCGARVVAARGGRVTFRQYQAGGGGNYVIISGRKSRYDYAYMHLAGPAKVRPGQRVRTGQLIGRVGDTGNATGCLLHFELWKGAWQQGGTPMRTVKRIVRKWDSWS